MASIAILGGTGHQGGGLAQRFAAAGARVIVGSRDPERAREIVTGWNTPGQSIEVAGNAEAVDRGEVIVLAVPFTSIDALLGEVGSHFKAGAVVIDVTVPVDVCRRPDGDARRGGGIGIGAYPRAASRERRSRCGLQDAAGARARRSATAARLRRVRLRRF